MPRRPLSYERGDSFPRCRLDPGRPPAPPHRRITGFIPAGRPAVAPRRKVAPPFAPPEIAPEHPPEHSPQSRPATAAEPGTDNGNRPENDRSDCPLFDRVRQAISEQIQEAQWRVWCANGESSRELNLGGMPPVSFPSPGGQRASDPSSRSARAYRPDDAGRAAKPGDHIAPRRAAHREDVHIGYPTRPPPVSRTRPARDFNLAPLLGRRPQVEPRSGPRLGRRPQVESRSGPRLGRRPQVEPRSGSRLGRRP